MGTRGTCGFIYKENLNLSYNQFDSYPDGLGNDMIQLIIDINKTGDWKKFKENASKIKNIIEQDIDENIIEKYKKYADLSVSSQSYDDPYCLFRGIQGSIWLKEMYNGDLEHFNFDNDFIKESLFCEYGYIINLDNMIFEFYEGFQHTQQINSKFEIVDSVDGIKSTGYYSCKLIEIISLEKVNEETLDIIKNRIEKEVQGIENYAVSNYLKKIQRKKKLEKIKENL